MSLKVELEIWSAALDDFDKGEYDNAALHFQKIAETSRIHYNLGIILAIKSDHRNAIWSLRRGLESFRGSLLCPFPVLQDCEIKAHRLIRQSMRDNHTIDYKQLGLDYQLYRFAIGSVIYLQLLIPK